MSIRPCPVSNAHEPHHWYPAPFESIFRDVYHECQGVTL